MVISTNPVNIKLGSNLFNGTIQYYKSNSQNYLSYVKVTVSTSLEGKNPYCTFDPDSCENSWETKMNQDTPQWYQVELNHALLFATHYCILSSRNEKGSIYHLLGWDLYASIDFFHWEKIDTHITNDLDGPSTSHPYQIQKSGMYRFFRIVQNTKNSNNSYGFSIRQFELFGILYESNYVPFRPRIFPKVWCYNTPFSLFLSFFSR